MRRSGATLQTAQRHGRRSAARAGRDTHLDAGLRGEYHGFNWNTGAFRAANHDDILFVTSDQTGFGYFRNFGETRRQGIELSLNRRIGKVTVGAGYTYLNATFQSEETVNGEGNSSNDAAEDGEPGLEG